MKNLKDFNKSTTKPNNTTSTGKIKLKVLLVFSFLIIALVFAQIIFSSNLAVDGQKLSNVNSEIKQLEASNNILRVAIAKESSFSSLSLKAQELGFAKAGDILSRI